MRKSIYSNMYVGYGNGLILDDYILLKHLYMKSFDGIARYISDLKSADSNLRLSSQVLMPNHFYFRFRFLYYFFLSIRLCLYKGVVWFPFTYAPIGLWGKYILTVHDCRNFGYEKSYWFKRNYIRYSITKSYMSIAISNFTKNELVRYGIGADILTMYNPIKSGVDNKIKRKPVGSYYVYVGHIVKRKNIAGLLRYLEKNKQIKELHVVGLGDKELIQRLMSNDRVVYHGYLSHHAIDELCRGMDTYINLSEYEGFSYAPLEFALKGLAVVLSDIPVHREIHSNYSHFVGLLDLEARLNTEEKSIELPTAEDYLRVITNHIENR